MTQLLLSILVFTSLYLLIAISCYAVYSVCKYFLVSQAIVIACASYLTRTILKFSGLSIFPSIFVSITICIILVFLLEKTIYRPLRHKEISTFLILIVSLVVYTSLQNCLSLTWGDDTKILRVRDVKTGYGVLGAYITDIQITTFVVCVLCVVLNYIFLKYTKVGQRIRAVSSNKELANIQGINSDRVILWATGIGSGMAAIAGILVGFDTGLTPTMGFNLLLYGIVAMIIGGVGSTKGLIGGAFLLAAAQHLTAYYIDSKWMNAITYIILIAFLIWRPLGFSGQRLKKIEI